MISLVVMGMAVGPMLFVPMSVFMIQMFDWRLTLLIYGCVYLFVLMPLFWLLYRDKPEDKGISPFGEENVRNGKESTANSDKAIKNKDLNVDQKLKGMALFRLPVTWFIIIPFFICGFTDIGLIQTHLVPLMDERNFTGTTIASIMFFYGLINILGTVVIGYLTDKISSAKILVFLFFMRIIGIIILFFAHDPIFLFVFALLYAATDIASVTPFTKMCAKIYGVQQMGSAFGTLTFFHQFGAAVGSFVPGILFSLSLNYQSSLIFSAIILTIGSLFLMLIKENSVLKHSSVQ